MNPILVMSTALGYFFNLYAGRPLVREGGVLIVSHPTPWEFHPVHHPSYIDFFEQVLSETTDPLEVEKTYEQAYAEDEWYRHLYRTSYAYHGVHPFYMWYWGSHALQHLGAVIVVGGDAKAVRRLGFKPATTMADALEMASDVVGRDPVHHPLPLPAADDGRRDVRLPSLRRSSPCRPPPGSPAGAPGPTSYERPPVARRSGADYDTLGPPAPSPATSGC